MGKKALDVSEVKKLISLRQKGYSLNEIKKNTNYGFGTIFRYVSKTKILPKYRALLKGKRGGSKIKSEKDWLEAKNKANSLINDFDFEKRMIILSCLYWGEGNKTELNVINSDPDLIRIIIICLKDLGIKNSELKISLRLFEDLNKKNAIDFWSQHIGVDPDTITKFEIIRGKKIGKLPFGMCRVRVKKAGKYFKLIMSMIDLIKYGIK